MRLLIRGDYLEKKENILLVGNPGTGKSHLATALGFAACQDGRRVKFTSVSELVTQMLELREQRSLQRLHKQLDRLDLLILDELGYVPFSKAGAELLFDVVSRAYERTSLIVTTNLPFENWTEVLGNGTAHRSVARPPDSSRAHPGSQRRQLPPGRRQKAPQGPVRPRAVPLVESVGRSALKVKSELLPMPRPILQPVVSQIKRTRISRIGVVRFEAFSPLSGRKAGRGGSDDARVRNGLCPRGPGIFWRNGKQETANPPLRWICGKSGRLMPFTTGARAITSQAQPQAAALKC